MKIILIDNYDSFTFNLRELLNRFETDVTVVRNDKFDPADLYRYDAIIISPGPGKPSESGFIKEVIRRYHSTKPILGICLGMQAIAEELGGELNYLDKPVHGLASEIEHNGDEIFKGVSNPFEVGRYHSIVVNENSLPLNIKPISIGPNSILMGIRLQNFPVYGLQFHPESILTPQGEQMIANFLNIAKNRLHEKVIRQAV